jgi:putative transposase
MEITKGRGYVYSLRYHIVFCTKYRHKVISGAFEEWLKDMFQSIAKTNGFKIITMEVMPDHIHFLIDCTPQHFIPNIIKALKGNSARFAFKEFPELKKKLWGGHLWNPSYFVCSISDVTEQVIVNYINSQKEGRQNENS